MTTMLAFSKQQGLRVCGWLAAIAMVAASLSAQRPAPRIQSEISLSDVTPVKAALGQFAQPRFDAGRMPVDTRLTGMLVTFNRSAAQQADLEALLAAQQNPASPLFHQWLTPEQFGARFGMAQADLDKVQAWLQQQGFSIEWVARSRNAIRFSGTVNQVDLAFQTQMHYYKADGEQHFAPSTPLSLPAAFAGTIESIRGVSDFRLKPLHIPANKSPRPDYTFWGGDNAQHVLFAPGDIKVAYDVNPLATSSITGTGQTIAVMGQTSVSVSDIEHFQTASGLTVKDPTLVLVPNTGTATACSGDQGESDLDLEWSGAMAPGATVKFVYTGATAGNCNSPGNNGVFDSIQYAVDNQIGDVITISYGACELELGTFTQDSIYQQAATQGQSIVASTGDTGSTGCFGFSNLTTTQQQSLAVSYPASSAYVTAVGGTEITAANDVVGPFWTTDGTTSNGNILLTSAISYIPEVVWNDDALAGSFSPSQGGGLSATGGGASTLYTTKPTWQTGVLGIPADSKRDLPDVSFYSSPNLPGYLYCTSDTSDWYTGHQTGSCVSGNFYDANGYFTIAGGTSFAAPIFAGMVALINQKANYVTGSGFLNPKLYQLASNAATYASAFHDVTTGSNYCLAGTTYGYCNSGGATEGYAATAGYDRATGLGSIDVNNLATAWPLGSRTASSTALAAAVTPAVVGVGDAITVTIASQSSSVTTTPTGTLAVTVDGVAQSSSPTLTAGVATYTFTPSSTGSHLIAITYSGDSTYSTSAGSLTLNAVGGGATATTTTLAVSSTTPVAGVSVTLTATVAPAAATGIVTFLDGSTVLGTGNLAVGVATFATSSLSVGAHSITASYGGDSSYAESTSTATTVTVSLPTSNGTFTLTAGNATATQGSSATSTITVKPSPSPAYTGTVNIVPTGASANVSFCYTAATATVSTAANATGSLIIDTNLNDCGASNSSSKPNAKHLFVAGGKTHASQTKPLAFGGTAALGFAGIFVGLLGLRQRRFRVFLSLLVLAGIGLTLTACGGGSSSGGGGGGGNYTNKGTYTITVTGTDTSTSSITAMTTFTLTVQ